MRSFLRAILVAYAAWQSQPAPASEAVVGAGNFSPIVADLDKSIEFYHDVLGLDLPGAPASRAWGTDPALLNFLGTPTAQVRFTTARIPGSTIGVEMVDFKDIDRKPVQPRLQDPGAVRLILLVRDLDTMLSRLKKANVAFVKQGGAVVKDPDGHFIEFVQPDPLPETTAPAASNIIGARFGLTVADMDQTMRLYRDLLGFQPQIDSSLCTDKTTGAQVRRATARVPGSNVQVEFLEFKGIDRKPIAARIQDPGATRFQIRVRDSNAAVSALKTLGGAVITTGGDGGPIMMRNLRVAVVRELNNLFLVIMQ